MIVTSINVCNFIAVYILKIVIATVNWQCSDIAIELLIKSANKIGDKIQTIFVSIKIVDNQTIEVSVLFNRRHQVHCRY